MKLEGSTLRRGGGSRKGRVPKSPEHELIASLEGIRLSTETRLRGLALQHEKLQAHDDALGSVLLSLEALIEATRPLRRACADIGAEDDVLDDWAQIREVWHLLKNQLPYPGTRWPEQNDDEALSTMSSPVRADGEQEGERMPTAAASGGARPTSGAGRADRTFAGDCSCNGSRAERCCDRGGDRISAGAAAGGHISRNGDGESQNGRSDRTPSWARYLGLEEGPEALLQRYGSMTASDTAKRVQQYIHACSVELYRLQVGATAQSVVRERLGEQLHRLMAFSSGLLVAKPQLLGEVSVYSLETLQPYTDGPPPPEHWHFAVKQARMSKRQELAACHLMKLYHSRLAVLLPRREEVLRLQVECADDSDAQHEVLVDLVRVQSEYAFTAMAFSNALYGSLLEPQQAAAIWVSSFPYVPQLVVIDQALQALGAKAECEQQQQQERQPLDQQQRGAVPCRRRREQQ